MTPEPAVTVFVVVANLGGVLDHRDWRTLHVEVGEMMSRGGAVFQDQWWSPPNVDWQTACWCIDVHRGIIDRLKGEIAAIGAKYGRGLVGWSEVASSSVLG